MEKSDRYIYFFNGKLTSAECAFPEKEKKLFEVCIYIYIYINRVRQKKEMGKLKLRLQSIITGYTPFEKKGNNN